MLSINDLIEVIMVNQQWTFIPLVPGDEQFDKYWSIVKSIKDEASCYTFNYQGDQFRTKHVLNNPFVSFLYAIQFKNKQAFLRDRFVGIYMHSRTVLNSNQENAYLEINTQDMNSSGSKIVLTYDLYQSELLEWPYQTNCRFYNRTTNFLSQGHCLDDCRIVNYNKAFSITPSEVLFQENDPYSKEIRFDQWSDYKNPNQSFKDCMDLIEDKCKNVSCSNDDCVKFEYVPMIRKNEPSENLTIGVTTARGPDFNVWFAPSINLIDFVTYVLTTIGFWTGFAPLSLYFYPRNKSQLTNGSRPKRNSERENIYDLIRTMQQTIDFERQYTREKFKQLFLSTMNN